MQEKSHDVDFCVVGGGLAGMCAAITAARRGIKTALVHDRPVLGGNASSEIRMWIGGCHGRNLHETGLIEEIMLENMYRNPAGNYSIWDSVLYEKCRFQPNLQLFLNASVIEAETCNNRIAAVTAWQLTTETRHTIRARYFADCSGDSILAPLSGADFRIGREAQSEFGEPAGQESADSKTMGLSCLLQARETGEVRTFTPPAWAHKYTTCEALKNRGHIIGETNFWWIELGGSRDSIHDAEEMRDELLKIAFGVWDHIKNHCKAQDASKWELEWIGFLPGKRESRRYLGGHILTQNEVEAGGKFADTIAYGGWTMDDHPPEGFLFDGQPTRHWPAPTPFGISYGCLYSRNIENLFCAGRNISATHMGISSTRVMATCALLGQAAGTAAALAVQHACRPADIRGGHISTLQQWLMEDDCYLPGFTRQVTALTAAAHCSSSAGAAENLRNGIDRPVGDADNCWDAAPGQWAEYRWETPQAVAGVRLVFDSDCSRANTSNMPCCYPLNAKAVQPPPQLVRAFRIEAEDAAGQWRTVARIDNNHQRLVRVPLDVKATALRLIPEATRGDESARVFAWDVV